MVATSASTAWMLRDPLRAEVDFTVHGDYPWLAPTLAGAERRPDGTWTISYSRDQPIPKRDVTFHSLSVSIDGFKMAHARDARPATSFTALVDRVTVTDPTRPPEIHIPSGHEVLAEVRCPRCGDTVTTRVHVEVTTKQLRIDRGHSPVVTIPHACRDRR